MLFNCMVDNMGVFMIANVITNIFNTIISLITNGLNNFAINEYVSLWGFMIWTIYISIILWFVNKLMKAVDNG